MAELLGLVTRFFAHLLAVYHLLPRVVVARKVWRVDDRDERVAARVAAVVSARPAPQSMCSMERLASMRGGPLAHSVLPRPAHSWTTSASVSPLPTS